MNDAVGVEVRETVENAFSDLAEYFLTRAAAELLDFAVHGVERAAFAKLHGDADCAGGVVDKGAVVFADVVGCAVLVEGKLTHDLLLDFGVGVRGDDL